MHERRETVEVDGERRIRLFGCVMARIWKEYGEEKLGSLYCYVDLAKYMAFNPNFKLTHLRALPHGDEYCELAVKPTSAKEREDFSAEDSDRLYTDKT
jgi:hypothetical protein